MRLGLNAKIAIALLGLVCGLRICWLGFRASFLSSFQRQMTDLRNPSGVGTRTVSRFYRVFAYFWVGPEESWTNVFNWDSDVARKFEKEKSIGSQIFVWSVLLVLCAFIASLL